MTDNIPISPATSHAAAAARSDRHKQDVASETEKGVEVPVEVDLERRPSSDSFPKVEDAPPDGGYGWVCVICNAFINGESMNLCLSYVKS